MAELDMTELILSYRDALASLAESNGVNVKQSKIHPDDMTWPQRSAAEYFALSWHNRGRKF